MKKYHKIFNATITLFLILIPNISTAQVMNSKFDIYANFGYGIPRSGYYLGESQKFDNSNVLIEVEDHYFNYGKGLKLGLGTNLKTMENLKVQFSFNYTRSIPSIKVKFENSISKNTDKHTYNLFGLNLALIPYFNLFNLLEMYVGVGVGIYFTTLKIESSNNQTNRYEGYIKTKPALGFCAKLGTDLPLNDVISPFFELSLNQISFKGKSYRKTSTNEEGRQISFEKDSNTLEAPPKIPGSNFGILLGIRFIIL